MLAGPMPLRVEQDFRNRRMIAFGSDARQGKRQHALGCHKAGTVAERLLGIGLVRINTETARL